MNMLVLGHAEDVFSKKLDGEFRPHEQYRKVSQSWVFHK